MLKSYKISQYCQEYSPQWACPMPQGCPPEDVLVPFEHPFFRLTENEESCCEQDFMSYAELDPERSWGDLLPLAVGISLIDNEIKARKNLKLPMFRKYRGIVCLMLYPQQGVVKQTGIHRSHYTWWRTKQFKIQDSKMLAI